MENKQKKDMRIAILYHNNFGRNDGPPLYYYNVLKNQMEFYEVVHLIPTGSLKRFGEFDYTFWIDYGEDGLPVDHDWKIPKHMGKTIYVCSDAHIEDKGKSYRLNKAKGFDYVFFNQLRGKEESGIDSSQVVLHAAEPRAYPRFEIIKKYDVCFIGHMQETVNYNGFTRLDFLHEMFAEFPNFYYGARSPQDPTKNLFEDASKRFSESRVVLNVSITDDINMRVFETMASGSLLLTNHIPTLNLVGDDGVHFVTYKTIEEAKEKARYYIEHDEEREKIAAAGHKHFLQNHTYKHRIESIFDFIEREK